MLSYVYLLDEDRAQTNRSKADELYAASIPGAQLSDGTTIDILAHGESAVAYIRSPFLAECTVLAPRDAGLGDGSYWIDLYGYNHRNDAMIPNGKVDIGISFPAQGLPKLVGVEATYISDGIIAGSSCAVSEDTHLIRQPIPFGLNFGLGGVMEDLETHYTGVFTTQKFSSENIGFQGVVSFTSQGNYLYCSSAYGVDRTNPAAPVYRAVFGTVYEETQSLTVQTYNSGNSDVQYKVVMVGFLYASLGRNSAFDYGLYSLGTHVMRYDDAGGMISSQFPVIVPLGNNRVVTLHPVRNTNAAYLFGGTFSVASTLINGTGFSQTALSTTAVTNGWFYQTTRNYGVPADTSLTLTSDDIKLNYLMETLTFSANFVVPLSQDETLILGHKVYVGYDEGNLDWSTATLLGSAQHMCYSVTSSGFAEKGTVILYYDDLYDGTHPVTGGTTLIYDYDAVGMLWVGDGKIAAFFAGRSATFTGSAPAWTASGLYRVISYDGGATWGAPEHIYLNWGEAGPPPTIRISPPKCIGFTAGNPSEAVILLGVTFGEPATGGTSLTKTTMFTSSDSGLTFGLSPAGMVGMEYFIPAGGWIFQSGRGITSVQDWGNHEDGYAPSPYRHLPTYYGTPTAACRDSSNDAGL